MGVQGRVLEDSGGGGRLAYAVFLLLGVGDLLPWNTVIAAADWWEVQFAGRHMNRYLTISYLPSEFVAMMLFTFHLHGRVPTALRLGGGFSGFAAVMCALPGLLYAGSSTGVQVAILCLAVVCGLCDASCQGGLLSLASHLHPRYVQAAAVGLSCSGVVASSLRCITKATLSSSDSGLRTSAVLFFGLAAGYMALCAATSAWVLPRLAVVRRARAAGRAAAQGAAEEEGECKGEAEAEAAEAGSMAACQHHHHHLQQQQYGSGACQHCLVLAADAKTCPAAAALALEAAGCNPGSSAKLADEAAKHAGLQQPAAGRPPAGSADSRAGDRVSKAATLHPAKSGVWATVRKAASARQVQEGLAVLRQVWVLSLGLLILYTVTFCIFPGVLVENVGDSSLGSWYPVLLIALYNAGELAGRMSTALRPLQMRSPTGMLLWAALRVVYAPAFYFAASQGAGEAWMSVLSFTLGASNGYFTCCMLLRAPELVPPAAASLVGDLMVLSIIAGLNVGSGLGFLWLLDK